MSMCDHAHEHAVARCCGVSERVGRAEYVDV
jgi:hypothetical protein